MSILDPLKRVERLGKAKPKRHVNAADLLPEQRQYNRYNGSITTPPCTEGVRWFVLQSPIDIPEVQIAAFQAIFKNNKRPVQSSNGREVLMNFSAN